LILNTEFEPAKSNILKGNEPRAIRQQMTQKIKNLRLYMKKEGVRGKKLWCRQVLKLNRRAADEVEPPSGKINVRKLLNQLSQLWFQKPVRGLSAELKEAKTND